jgi:hypothetical protein
MVKKPSVSRENIFISWNPYAFLPRMIVELKIFVMKKGEEESLDSLRNTPAPEESKTLSRI